VTIADIEDRIKSITESQRDGETAHIQEDNLYKAFIMYVASLPNLPHDLAIKAQWCLKTQVIDFPRWYA